MPQTSTENTCGGSAAAPKSSANRSGMSSWGLEPKTEPRQRKKEQDSPKTSSRQSKPDPRQPQDSPREPQGSPLTWPLTCDERTSQKETGRGRRSTQGILHSVVSDHATDVICFMILIHFKCRGLCCSLSIISDFSTYHFSRQGLFRCLCTTSDLRHLLPFRGEDNLVAFV